MNFYLAKKKKVIDKGEVREFFFFFKSNQDKFLGKKLWMKIRDLWEQLF